MITAVHTNNGNVLADKLSKVIEDSEEVRSICALLCRHAGTLHRLAEDECNGHPAMGDPYIPIERAYKLQERWEKRVEAGQTRALHRMEDLTAQLPDKWRLDAETDPRGCSVLVYEGEIDFYGDSWGEPRGVCIPITRY